MSRCPTTVSIAGPGSRASVPHHMPPPRLMARLAIMLMHSHRNVLLPRRLMYALFSPTSPNPQTPKVPLSLCSLSRALHLFSLFLLGLRFPSLSLASVSRSLAAQLLHLSRPSPEPRAAGTKPSQVTSGTTFLVALPQIWSPALVRHSRGRHDSATLGTRAGEWERDHPLSSPCCFCTPNLGLISQLGLCCSIRFRILMFCFHDEKGPRIQGILEELSSLKKFSSPRISTSLSYFLLDQQDPRSSFSQAIPFHKRKPSLLLEYLFFNGLCHGSRKHIPLACQLSTSIKRTTYSRLHPFTTLHTNRFVRGFRTRPQRS